MEVTFLSFSRFSLCVGIWQRGWLEILFSEHMTSVDPEKTRTTTILLCTWGFGGEMAFLLPSEFQAGNSVIQDRRTRENQASIYYPLFLMYT